MPWIEWMITTFYGCKNCAGKSFQQNDHEGNFCNAHAIHVRNSIILKLYLLPWRF